MENKKSNENNKDTGIVTSVSDKRIYCLTIIGEIEGHTVLPENSKSTKYEHIIPEIISVEEDKNIDAMLIVLNTVGGDVEAGLAIAELISGMKKPTASLVLGGGHSIGVPLAVCAKRSFIVPSATMTVHPVRTTGLILGVPQVFNYFEKMQARITDFIVRNSHISPERFNELLMETTELVTDIGTVLDGENAVKEGIIDQIGNISDVIDYLYKQTEQK